MENIVTKIIEIDQQADEKLAASQEEMRKILADARVQAEQCRSALQAAADKRIAAVTAFHQSEYERQSAVLHEASEQAKTSLDKSFQTQHTTLEDELFRAVLRS